MIFQIREIKTYLLFAYFPPLDLFTVDLNINLRSLLENEALIHFLKQCTTFLTRSHVLVSTLTKFHSAKLKRLKYSFK